MADVLTEKQRSFCMSRIKGRDTKPEVTLRKELWRLGFRYRLRSKLPGKPDLVFPKYRAVLFVDGCFWHGCPRHMVRPKTNYSFWADKVRQNKARDRRVNKILKNNGWRVIRVWEHDIRVGKTAGCLNIAKQIKAHN